MCLLSRFGVSSWWCGSPLVFSVLCGMMKLSTAWSSGCQISTLPSASPPPGVAPASQPGPWFTELTLSVTVSHLQFWVPLSSVVHSVSFVCLFFVGGGDQSVQGVVLLYPRGGWGIPCDTWGSPVWSAEGLSSIFGAGSWWVSGRTGQCAGWMDDVVWVWWHACSFSVFWPGEAFHGLQVLGAKVSPLPGASLPPSMSPASQ
jgi:hypothetical protein